jgi:hypothetical protein
MSRRFYADALRVVIYDEAPGGGDPLDPNSLMNRPVVSPMSWLDSVYFHSDLNYYNTVLYQPSVTVNHPEVSGRSDQITANVTYGGRIVTTTHHLVQHNLGYVPKFFVAYNGRMMPHGYPIQNTSSSRKRLVAAYATTTEIRLWECGVSDTQALPAASFNYAVQVFASSSRDPALPNLLIEPGNVVFGQGKFRMDRPPIRVPLSGESPFYQATDRTAAIWNGALRAFLPNGSYQDFGNFTGSLGAPGFINLAAGV